MVLHQIGILLSKLQLRKQDDEPRHHPGQNRGTVDDDEQVGSRFAHLRQNGVKDKTNQNPAGNR